MNSERCLHCLMKAISCYVQKDNRSWAYLYECAYCYLHSLNDKNNIIILNTDLVTLTKLSYQVPAFIKKYSCDLQNALLGYEHVKSELYWITQFEMLLGVTSGDGINEYGYAYYGENIKLNILYSIER